ncbi:MAG: MaoC/PaaZ C-terminal domain-containing protein [Candidatus Thorarchaeota archaeon]|jgi:acyl dehydratase
MGREFALAIDSIFPHRLIKKGTRYLGSDSPRGPFDQQRWRIVGTEPFVLDRSFIGKEYRSRPQIAKAEDMTQYAQATNETNPQYYDTESSEGLISPPLYPVVFLPELLSQLVDDAENMNLDILRVVHAEHEMWWRNRIRPGEKIISTARIVNIEKLGANELLDMDIQCTCEDAVLVEMRYRLMMRGKKKAEKREPTVSNQTSTHREKLAERTILVTDDQGKRYAEASGDHNPIHVSDEIAQSVGLPSAILHGLCTMAFASQTIVDEILGGDSAKLRHMKVRFSKPVLMGEALTTEVYDAGLQEDGCHVVHFETKNPSNLPVLTNGMARFTM